MLPADEERIPARTSGEEIFSLAVPFAAVASEPRIGAREAQGKKPHQGIFSKTRANRISEIRAKWSGTHQDRKCSWSKTVSGSALDANGNTLSDAQGRSFTWDYENRLTSATVPGTGTVNFKYDPFSRRIEKISPNFTSVFVYDADNLLETLNASGSEVASYTQTQKIDEALAELRSNTTDYYEADGLGSITSLSTSAAALANTYTYDSFGNTTASTGTLRNYFQYAGRDFDSETGLYFNRTRYYDPNIGRFISEDSIGFKGGIDFYAYVNNRPINSTDPTGLKPCGTDCTQAAPLPSNSPKCDNYGSETYLGASEKCFCKCAGDSAWAQKVRGCLACAFENNMDKTARHKQCYDAAGWSNAPWLTLANCERKCLFSH